MLPILDRRHSEGFVSPQVEITTASGKRFGLSRLILKLFQSVTPAKQSRQTTTHNGLISLFLRPDSPHWQCHFKLDNDTWHQATTGTAIFSDAQRRL